MRVAVVGHTEWVDFLQVATLPGPGDIVHVSRAWEAPGGGGAVAAVQLAKLAGEALFITALGDDERGHRAFESLRALGVRVEAAFRPTFQRRAITHLEASGERTISVVGDRLAPHADDDLPWHELRDVDAVYLTAADVEGVRLARAARVVVATSRVLTELAASRVPLDALVGSAVDPAETYGEGDLEPAPRLVVRTRGSEGGTYRRAGEEPQRFQPAPVPGPVADAYGCGDSFAATLTYGLGAGMSDEDAIGLAARAGACVLTGHGPYERQLTAADLD